MEEHKIDICALSEIKQKGKGEILYPGYLLKYSGKGKHERATAGVGILIKEKYVQSIEDTQYINERILRVTLNMGEEKLHLISVYAPDINKRKKESDDFYDHLQTKIDRLPKTEKMLIMGDLNARNKTKI